MMRKTPWLWGLKQIWSILTARVSMAANSWSLASAERLTLAVSIRTQRASMAETCCSSSPFLLTRQLSRIASEVGDVCLDGGYGPIEFGIPPIASSPGNIQQDHRREA